MSVYTVTQINSYIKNMFKQDFVLNNISLKGEISNLKYHNSGHIYFTLKDEKATISVIMFASFAGRLSFELSNGMMVIVTGRVDVYERDGRYQLYANTIKMDGVGDLYLRYESLKARFEEMGYFSDIYKKEIPKYAKVIGVVTAPTGAAIQDIIKITHRRNPYVQLILYPAQVQGENAKYSIVKGIQILDRMNTDVIIVGRGGGSIEDLWAFNEEIVVEAIFNAQTPVISAVGHQTDTTISDYVADQVASTPSAAAEIAVTELKVITDKIEGFNQYINKYMLNIISYYRNIVEKYALTLKINNPISKADENRQRLINVQDRLNDLIKNIFKEKRHCLEVYASKLNGLSPLNKLCQGYSYAEDESGNNISSVNDISEGDIMNIYVKDGMITAKAMEVTDGKITNA